MAGRYFAAGRYQGAKDENFLYVTTAVNIRFGKAEPAKALPIFYTQTHQPNTQLSGVHHEKDLSEVAHYLASTEIIIPLWKPTIFSYIIYPDLFFQKIAALK